MLGHRKNEDIKYRQNRIDITVYAGSRAALLLEVKRDWGLGENSSDVIQQAYQYALKHGIRLVAITNGDYYLIFDRASSVAARTLCKPSSRA